MHLELPNTHTRTVLRLVYEVVKKTPLNCPSKAAAVGASVLLVLASAIISRFAISTMEEVNHLRSEDICGGCDLRNTCKHSLAKDAA